MASFFIRQFVRREGSGRRSQRECVTNEITVWLHVAVRAESLHHRLSSVRIRNRGPTFARNQIAPSSFIRLLTT